MPWQFTVLGLRPAGEPHRDGQTRPCSSCGCNIAALGSIIVQRRQRRGRRHLGFQHRCERRKWGEATSSVTSTGESTGVSGGAGGDQPCDQVSCFGYIFACGDCADNDGDGSVDGAEAACLGACDDSEVLYGASHHFSQGPCARDCYFDADPIGGVADDCFWSYECDPPSTPPTYGPTGECEYDPDAPIPGTTSGCAELESSQSQQCLDVCGPLVPTGAIASGAASCPRAAGPSCGSTRRTNRVRIGAATRSRWATRRDAARARRLGLASMHATTARSASERCPSRTGVRSKRARTGALPAASPGRRPAEPTRIASPGAVSRCSNTHFDRARHSTPRVSCARRKRASARCDHGEKRAT